MLVESPLIGDTVRTPVRVWGSADTFEAVFRLKVTDTTGRTTADVRVTATSGTGTRGAFDVTFPYKPVRTGPGLLTAYYLSVRDGRAVTVPLYLNRLGEGRPDRTRLRGDVGRPAGVGGPAQLLTSPHRRTR
ncbi:Gmad2 immunoglobulin-like domain-containing protein [Streptomyces sp. NPDC059629]|uniref:Gmad2 immunoglobulin-like domain-containing protein n=1 Tax=Streptomyces sp. NPDC059629 TaxID=3346889 RepID=UPI0036AE108B